jgi:hypothetical protein
MEYTTIILEPSIKTGNSLEFNGIQNTRSLRLKMFNMTPIPTVVKGYNDFINFYVNKKLYTATIEDGYYNVYTIGDAIGKAMSKAYQEDVTVEKKGNDTFSCSSEKSKLEFMFNSYTSDDTWDLPMQRLSVSSLLGLRNKPNKDIWGGYEFEADFPFNPKSVRWLTFEFTVTTTPQSLITPAPISTTTYSIPINIDQENPCSSIPQTINLATTGDNTSISLAIYLENSRIRFCPNNFVFYIEMSNIHR